MSKRGLVVGRTEFSNSNVTITLITHFNGFLKNLMIIFVTSEDIKENI